MLLAAFIAGSIDAVVGGGGLIQIPALFALHPEQSAATLFGTNKFASIFGTANASWRYARRVVMPWRSILPAALGALLFSYLGAAAVAWLPKESIRPLILLLLIFAAVYTLKKKNFGQEHQPLLAGHHELLWAFVLGAAIGFYDGFFGPGTGSFLIFLFVHFFGFDFLHASASAKVVNVVTNFAALAYFIPNAYLLPWLAVGMAVANFGGSHAGTWLALKYGNGAIRKVFLLIVGMLILRFAWDTVKML